MKEQPKKEVPPSPYDVKDPPLPIVKGREEA